MKYKVSQLSMEDFILEHNPFVFRDEKDHFCYFKNLALVYKELFERMFKRFPKGYIEMSLFLVEECHFELQDAKDFVHSWMKLGYKGDPVVINWEAPAMRDVTLRQIVQGMHTLPETEFNESMFRSALNLFCADHDLHFIAQ